MSYFRDISQIYTMNLCLLKRCSLIATGISIIIIRQSDDLLLVGMGIAIPIGLIHLLPRFLLLFFLYNQFTLKEPIYMKYFTQTYSIDVVSNSSVKTVSYYWKGAPLCRRVSPTNYAHWFIEVKLQVCYIQWKIHLPEIFILVLLHHTHLQIRQAWSISNMILSCALALQ